jgi:hypothetical protein
VQLLKPREIAVSLDIDASKSNKKILLIGSLSALVIIYIVGVVLYLHRNSNTDDTTIVSSIKAAFLNEVELSRSTIECTSEKGVVTLTGLVNSDTEKSNAIRLANTQRGVKQVLDHLIVASTSVASPNAQPTDASLSPGSPPLAGTSYPQPNLPTIPASAEIEAER